MFNLRFFPLGSHMSVDIWFRVVKKRALREKYPYRELFWSAFSRIRTEYGEILSVFNPNAEKCRPGELRIRTLFTQWWGLENWKRIYLKVWLMPRHWYFVGCFISLFKLMLSCLRLLRKIILNASSQNSFCENSRYYLMNKPCVLHLWKKDISHSSKNTSRENAPQNKIQTLKKIWIWTFG